MEIASPESLGTLAWGVSRSIGATLDIEMRAADPRYDFFSPRPVIYALWHGRLFMPLYCMRNQGILVLVSEHRDGAIITSTLVAAGYGTVRGSTTRGGARALARMVRLVRDGRKVAFTPDGPRGPKWHFQTGAVYAAAKTGIPIVPLAGSARKAWYFKSWDAFQYPVPFTRGVLLAGEPFHVDADTGRESIEKHRLEIERRMHSLTRKADEIAGITA